MKIGLFSDPHYCDADEIGGGRRPRLSLNKIKEAMEAFKKEKVSCCFCLGDLTDNAHTETKETARQNLNLVMEIINSYGIPFNLVLGNHDCLTLNRNDYKNENIHTPPYIFETEKYNFIALDGNFRSDFRHFDEAGVVWDDSNLPPEQIEFLHKALLDSQKECVVLIHENLDPTVQYQHIVKNAQEVREIIKNSGKVKMVIQGHYHEGSQRVIDGILYLTLEAMCQGEKNSYKIIEI